MLSAPHSRSAHVRRNLHVMMSCVPCTVKMASRKMIMAVISASAMNVHK